MSWGQQQLQDPRPGHSTSPSEESTTSEPITIASVSSPIPSSSQHLHPAFFEPTHSAEHRSFTPPESFGSRILDGPLLPAFPGSISGSSSGESSFRGSVGLGSRLSPTGAPAFARRVVSTPLPSPSPRSPLSAGASFPHSHQHSDDPTFRLRSAQFPLPGTHSSPSIVPSPSQKSRRRSSTSAPHGALVGSYENSLLAGRLSATPSPPIDFHASIGVLGSSDSPSKLRCPTHLHIPFGATFYPNVESGTSSPFVGTIDLEAHYLALLSPPCDPLPRFPGYRLPPRGQVQLVIKNPNSTAIKLFLIPYDLTGLDRNGEGGKTFLRQKSYAVLDEGSDEGKGRLRYAVHLQFCAPPTSGESRFYLHNTIRVVFASRALDSTERLRVVAEGPEGAGGSERTSEERFAPYRGPGSEWEMARKKAKEREKARKREVVVGLADAVMRLEEEDEGTQAMSLDTDYISESFELPTPPGPRLNTPPPESPPRLPISLSTLSHVLPSFDLSFERPASPVVVAVGGRSGLSTSRPGSRAAGERERERWKR